MPMMVKEWLLIEMVLTAIALANRRYAIADDGDGVLFGNDPRRH